MGKLLFVVLFLSFFQVEKVRADAPLRVLFGDTFPPLMWNDSGTPRGIAVEMAKAIFSKAGYAIKIETCPWVRCQLIAQHEGAFIVGFSKNEERVKTFIYSEVYMYDDVVLVVKKGNEFPFEKDEDLIGKKIGVQNGSSYGPRFENLKKLFKEFTDSGDILRIKKILAGRIDAGVFSLGEAGVLYALKLSEVAPGSLVVLRESIAQDPNFIATGMGTKDGKTILEKLNQSIHKLEKDGTLKKIMNGPF